MEAADQDIGLKPADNIQYASVGAAAEQDPPAAFFHEQVLFMTKIFWPEDTVLQDGKAESAQIVVLSHLFAGMESYAVGDYGNVPGIEQLSMLWKGGVQTDIFCGTMVMGLECMTVNIDGRGMIKRKKPGKAAAVIVVAVGQNGDIHGDWDGKILDVEKYKNVVFEPYDLRWLEVVGQ